MSESPPLPDARDPLLADFWEAARDGHLVERRCSRCGRAQWPPRVRCLRCHGDRFATGPLEPAGILDAVTTVHRAFHPALEGDTPYAIGLVRLANGTRMVGRVLDPDRARIGMRVEASFRAIDDEITFIDWYVPDTR